MITSGKLNLKWFYDMDLAMIKTSFVFQDD